MMSCRTPLLMSSRAPLLTTRTLCSRHAATIQSKPPSRARHASAAPLVDEKTTESSAPTTLSALPTPVLLKSLLVSAISSNPYLLLPSLAFLSFLTRPNRGLLTDVDRNPLLHSVLKTLFYRQFCAGENAEETRNTMRHLRFMGFRGTILTYAKETVFDHKTNTVHGLGIDAEKDAESAYCSNIETRRKGALETVDLLGDGDQLALKLTGAAPRVTEAFAANELPPQQMMVALDEVCIWCKERGIRLLLDAESQHFQWGIFRAGLELMRKYNLDGYTTVYQTYQAYLKSTPTTLAEHLEMANAEGFTLGLKLVRGAYIGSDEVSFALLQLKDGRGGGGAASSSSPQVWKCSTWGTMGECVAYLLRRAVENRDAVSRTVDEYRALKAELGRRLRSRSFRPRPVG